MERGFLFWFRFWATVAGLLVPQLAKLLWLSDPMRQRASFLLFAVSFVPYGLLVIASLIVQERLSLVLALVALIGFEFWSVVKFMESQSSTAALGFFAIPLCQAAVVPPAAFALGYVARLSRPSKGAKGDPH